MSAITIQETLLNCDDGAVVRASDADHRSMLGVSQAGAFVQIDRVTMLELQRGVVDVHTAMTERWREQANGADLRPPQENYSTWKCSRRLSSASLELVVQPGSSPNVLFLITPSPAFPF